MSKDVLIREIIVSDILADLFRLSLVSEEEKQEIKSEFMQKTIDHYSEMEYGNNVA